MNGKTYWPVVVWAIVIFCLHIIPTDKIPKPPDWGISYDKVVHFAIFAILSSLLLRSRQLRDKEWNPNAFMIIILACTIYGLLMETVQILVPGREFNLVDLTADSLGALSGNFVYLGFVKLKKVLAKS